MVKKLMVLSLLVSSTLGCAIKSSYFVGVNQSKQGPMIGVVSYSAGKTADHFLKSWLLNLESGNLEKCYASFSEQIKQELSLQKFVAIRNELNTKYGQTQNTVGVQMPVTGIFPIIDEANFRGNTSAGIKYYDYVMGRYLSKRSVHNLVYFTGVALNQKQLQIVSFGVGKETYGSQDDGNYLYWFGYPAF